MDHSKLNVTHLRCVTSLLHMCDMTPSYVWHDSFICVIRLSFHLSVSQSWRTHSSHIHCICSRRHERSVGQAWLTHYTVYLRAQTIVSIITHISLTHSLHTHCIYSRRHEMRHVCQSWLYMTHSLHVQYITDIQVSWNASCISVMTVYDTFSECVIYSMYISHDCIWHIHCMYSIKLTYRCHEMRHVYQSWLFMSVLQCVAVCCSVLQCVAVYISHDYISNIQWLCHIQYVCQSWLYMTHSLHVQYITDTFTTPSICAHRT